MNYTVTITVTGTSDDGLTIRSQKCIASLDIFNDMKDEECGNFVKNTIEELVEGVTP
jgi:hypothetical protein